DAEFGQFLGVHVAARTGAQEDNVLQALAGAHRLGRHLRVVVQHKIVAGDHARHLVRTDLAPLVHRDGRIVRQYHAGEHRRQVIHGIKEQTLHPTPRFTPAETLRNANLWGKAGVESGHAAAHIGDEQARTPIPMISVEEARERILADLHPTPGEIVALANAWGRVTAQPIAARLTQPPADVSAMDGYALRAADGSLGARLSVIGAAPAGHPFEGTVGPGQAVRLFTGSVVPSGADGILLQEDATRDGETVTVNEAVVAGRHIRRAGQDFAAGDVVVAAVRRLTARDIGLAAAANHPWLTVHRRPRVAVLATGDEIAMPGEPIPPGGIVSSNSHA